MHNRKIAVIGWDSASFEIISPLLKAGVLPNLQALMERGSWGDLISSMHPISPTAWASFMTGMNPGKHRIFDFVSLTPKGDFEVVNGGCLGAPTIWQRMSLAGKRVGVVNVPMSYPPQKVNGWLIAGMDAPQLDRAFTYPPELTAILKSQIGKYRTGVKAKGHRWESVEKFTDRYVQNLCQNVQERADATTYLLQSQPVDFLVSVFTAPDRVQHALGSLMADGISPDDGIGQVYQACDQALGQILKQLDDGWTIFVMSDHGAATYKWTFELSTWLIKEGYLNLKSVPPSNLQPKFSYMRKVLHKLKGQPHRENPRLKQFMQQIVWGNTRAFALGSFGNIYITTKDRFPNGMIDRGSTEYEALCAQISDKLLQICSPVDGNPIVKAVYRAEDIYSGPFLQLAPDLLVETTSDYFVRNNLDHQRDKLVSPAGRYAGRSLSHTGKHTPRGLLVAAGAPIKAGSMMEEVHIMDLVPTILYLNKYPISRQMDGTPLLDWVNPSFTVDHLVTFQEEGENYRTIKEAPELTFEESSTFESHLRDLGYLD